MKNIVLFTGAGISAESGLATFRDAGGLWENYKIEEVATPDAFERKPSFVLDFYNIRRRELLNSSHNIAHMTLNKLQDKFNLSIITQNIDDLHERSGSIDVLHLHGKLRESRSTIDNRVYPIQGSELNIGDLCDKGGQLRPNIVWFGEDVPNMEIAVQKVLKADFFIIIGTSLNVYPAASLLNYAVNSDRVIHIDPEFHMYDGVEFICDKATSAVPNLVEELLSLKL